MEFVHLLNRAYLIPWNHSPELDSREKKAFRREIWIARVTLGLTLLSVLAFTIDSGLELARSREGGVSELLGRLVVAFLLSSALCYQLTRLAYLKRFLRRRAAPASELESVFGADAPAVTVLVPSYQEEPRAVRRTLLSAALQAVPHRRVVLLIDDPPSPADPVDAARLSAMRRLPRDLHARLAELALPFQQAHAAFTQRQRERKAIPEQERRRLAGLWLKAADALDRMADDTVVTDHTDVLFVERVLREPADALRARGSALLEESESARVDLAAEYRRLSALFEVEITSFERKRYANLSHEPNKAMNLNGYLALIGRAFREARTAQGPVLEPCDPAHATLRVPRADFVVVLDADSLLLPDYSLRLLHVMREPGHERVAVVQTPYASVAGAAGVLERTAGATTDVQLMSHQGSVLFDAGSWVGASAMVRRAALEDIAVSVSERGYRVRVFVRDRTLCEDTDTTVDLIRKGWSVYNYPDRLAYSATPPDFGSLLIQRRRWATGGLIILPNLTRYLLARPTPRRVVETSFRAQYILSAPLGGLAFVALLIHPFDSVRSYWVWLACLAWVFAFQRDLMHNGRRATSLFRALAMNAMLLPINLAGALHSLWQAFTGRKLPFQRTPKIPGKTAAPRLHLIAQLGLLAFTGVNALVHYAFGHKGLSTFYAGYAVAFAYAAHVFIGWEAFVQAFVRPWARRLNPRLKHPAMRWAGAACVGVLPLIYFFWAALQPSPGARSYAAAITIDDLPVISVTPLDDEARRQVTDDLLEHLADHRVPAVGFVNEYGLYGFDPEGRGAPQPAGVDLLQRWVDSGLELGNHTFAHADLHASSPAAFERNIVRGEIVTRELLRREGRQPRYFRHPYLHAGRDPAVRREIERFLAHRRYQVAPVTVDNEDWMFAAAYSKAAERGDTDLMRRVGAAYLLYTEQAIGYSEGLSRELFGRQIRQIVLLHANALNADYGDALLEMMERRGYSFITLDAALEDKAYASQDTYYGGEALNWLARWAVTRGVRTADNVLDDFPDVPSFVQAAAGLEPAVAAATSPSALTAGASNSVPIFQ